MALSPPCARHVEASPAESGRPSPMQEAWAGSGFTAPPRAPYRAVLIPCWLQARLVPDTGGVEPSAEQCPPASRRLPRGEGRRDSVCSGCSLP